MNLGGVVDWSSEWPFVEVFKTSRQWMEKGPKPFSYDDHGAPLLRPGQEVETLIFRDLDGHYPAGQYVATWQGTGEVEIRQFDVEQVVARRPGRCEFRVRPANGGILVKITASPPRDPIRNLKVWLPGFEDCRELFHPLYRERLAPFRILRFMDWQRTNGNPQVDWAERSKPDDLRWSLDTGVPLEICIDLANSCKADPWFCLPHQADDHYVQAFAALVKQRLAPERKLYVEYSNEVWNWGFAQSQFALTQGKKLKLAAPEQHRYYAQRSVEVFSIFESVFGSVQRLVRVLSGQFVNPRDCEIILSHRNAAKSADALAVGAYFGYEFGDPKKAAEIRQLTPDQLLARCGAYLDGAFRTSVQVQAALARKHNLQLLAYEGGQHLVGHGGAENDEELMKLFHAANRHPKMADLYRKQLTHWFADGGGAFIAFSFAGHYSKWGSWGTLEYQDQPVDRAPKYRALVEMSKELAGQ